MNDGDYHHLSDAIAGRDRERCRPAIPARHHQRSLVVGIDQPDQIAEDDGVLVAETDNVEDNARSKLKRKKLDMIAANHVGDGIAFDCDDNALTVIWPGGKVDVARGPKIDVARTLIALIVERLPPSDGPRRAARKRRTTPADPRTRLRSRRARRV